MWMVIFLAAQPMLESVLEEKSQRIAEVLLGSVSTFQLMIGKLLGGVGGSLTVVLVYGLGAIGLAWHFDALHLVPLRVIPWFLVYQVLAVMLFGSLFMAIGAAVNQLKEAQSMLLPVWLVMMFPLFIWFQAIREPMGGLATWMSFFPPATPLMMVLRIAATSAVPWWQAALGVVVLLATTLLIVLAAARIFRIGFLAQGKAPRLAELLRWALRG
jgi:ABC-2 type transport system permease protein